jgi:hypothetical protein
MSPVSKEATLADGTPFEKSGLKSAFVWFALSGGSPAPRGHVDVRTWILVASSRSRHPLGLEGCPLMAHSIPFLGDDEDAIIVELENQKNRL